MSHWHRAGLGISAAEARESSEALFSMACVLSEEGNEPLADLLEEIATALKREQPITVMLTPEERHAKTS